MPLDPSGSSGKKSHTSQLSSWAGTGCGVDHPSPLLPRSGHQLPLPLGEHQQIPLCASIHAGAGNPRGVTLEHTPCSLGPGSGLGRAILDDHGSSSEGILTPSLHYCAWETSPPPASPREEIKATFAPGPRVGPCLRSLQLHMGN